MFSSREREQPAPGFAAQQQTLSESTLTTTNASEGLEQARTLATDSPRAPGQSPGSMPGPTVPQHPVSDSDVACAAVAGGAAQQLIAPLPSTPIAQDAEREQQERGVEEDGRSQRGSTGGSENEGAGYGTAQASMPRNFRISLDGYSLQRDDDGTFAAYRINVTAGLHTWHVLRRCVRASR